MSTINKIKIEDVLYDIEDKEAREELQDKADKTEIPSIEGLASETYVNEAIANIPTGGSKEWKLIRTVTIPEDITTDTSGVIFKYALDDAPENGILFGFDTDENGEAFSCDEIVIETLASTPHTAQSITYKFTSAIPQYGGSGINGASIGVNSKNGYGITLIKFIGNKKAIEYRTTFGGGALNNTYNSGKTNNANVNKFEKVSTYMSNLSAYGFSVGSKFMFYGR